MPSFQDEGINGHRFGDYKTLPEGMTLAIALPSVQSFMTGVYSFGIDRYGRVSARYTDGKIESAFLNDGEIINAKNAMSLTRLVQDISRNENRPCPKCNQTDKGQTGEYPCSLCGLPRVWDDGVVKESLTGEKHGA